MVAHNGDDRLGRQTAVADEQDLENSLGNPDSLPECLCLVTCRIGSYRVYHP